MKPPPLLTPLFPGLDLATERMVRSGNADVATAVWFLCRDMSDFDVKFVAGRLGWTAKFGSEVDVLTTSFGWQKEKRIPLGMASASLPELLDEVVPAGDGIENW